MPQENNEFVGFAHLHVLVDDLDKASEFYRDVLGFIEMQSHEGLVNPGLAAYYGFGDEPEKLRLDFRFLFLPEVITIKLVKLTYEGYVHNTNPLSSSNDMQSTFGNVNSPYGNPQTTYGKHTVCGQRGLGPVSIVANDLEATYNRLLSMARNYSSKFKFQILSPPTFLSPLLPHQIGATNFSALYGQNEILQQIADSWPMRAKFHLIDPYGVQWEINNNVDSL